VDQAILADEECLVIIPFGHDWDDTEHTHPLPLASFLSPSIFVCSIQLRMFSICSCLAMSHVMYFGVPIDGAMEERGNYEFLNWALLD
jgi:hypothetical protein